MNHQGASFLPSGTDSKSGFGVSKGSAFTVVRKNGIANTNASVGLSRPKCPFCSVYEY